MNIRACKGCVYFTKHYGNKDSRGNRTVSNFWCVAKNGFIRNFPKQCELKKEAEGGRVMEVVKSDCKHYSKPTHWNGGEESCNLRDDWIIQCENCPHYDSKNRRTNADRIRSMTDEELSEWVIGIMCRTVKPYMEIREKVLRDDEFLTWLKQEVSE